jgi:hypothetical protein
MQLAEKRSQFIWFDRIAEQNHFNAHSDINYRPDVCCPDEKWNKSETRPKDIITGACPCDHLTNSIVSAGHITLSHGWTWRTVALHEMLHGQTDLCGQLVYKNVLTAALRIYQLLQSYSNNNTGKERNFRIILAVNWKYCWEAPGSPPGRVGIIRTCIWCRP